MINSTLEIEKKELIKNYDKAVPSIIKYMGSKKSILDFVIKAIDDNYKKGKICDLFAGTSILSGSLGRLVPMHANDIQEYSAILAQTYLANYEWNDYPTDILEQITSQASKYVETFKLENPTLIFDYPEKMTIANFIELETAQKELIHKEFENNNYHLFVKYYSGTYWSFNQCLWIDALRRVADECKAESLYYVILSSLMYAMSYNSQSTGHFAQYRDATNKSSKNDILIYRQKEILPYFEKKFLQLKNHLSENKLNHSITSLNYEQCLDLIEPETLVYADPPYAFVHYSRFYHALETLVKYDYPEVLHKGRYRVDRHQSPFCKSTEVKKAFETIFHKIREKKADLILSYSNTGMISLNDITTIGASILGSTYEITVREYDHIHSTMGRSDDRNKDVKEYLIITKYI